MSDGSAKYQPYPGNEQPIQMNQYPGVAQPGMAPQGMPPRYSSPEGMAPQYSDPQYSAPQAGLPPGLAYLATLNEVQIHQKLDVVEVVISIEMNNKYDICNNQGQKIMFAKEDTDCCTRQIFGTLRPFVMNVTDNFGQPLMLINRPLRCQATLLCCCCLQEMEIESPPGVLQGTVKQAWTCWIPKYYVYNSQNQRLFTIMGECCYFMCCTDVVFHVFDGDREQQEVAQIVKHWGGCREIFGAANDFSVKFLADLDLMQKVLLLGATFLIDYNYFERRANS